MLESLNTGTPVSNETYKRDIEIRKETYGKEDDVKETQKYEKETYGKTFERDLWNGR